MLKTRKDRCKAACVDGLGTVLRCTLAAGHAGDHLSRRHLLRGLRRTPFGEEMVKKFPVGSKRAGAWP